MMMAEPMTQMFKSLNTNSKKMYKKQKDVNSDISSICSSKTSVYSSTTNNNDWHRLLFARLKPGVTGKYRTTRKDGNKSDAFVCELLSSTSFEDSPVTLQAYSDDSCIVDNRQIILTQSDESKQFDSSIENSMRKDNRFVKRSISYRPGDNITSLKRRVRKQQMRHLQNQPSILQENTFQQPSPTDLFLISYPEETVLPGRYRQRKSSSVVPLPPLMNTTRVKPTHMHGFNLNFYGY